MAKIGNTDISKIYLGSTEVTKAYLGSSEVYSSFNLGPGPTELIAGSLDTAGFFGQTSQTDFGRTMTQVMSDLGITQGTAQNTSDPLLKFIHQGKIKYINKRTIRHSISWNDIASKINVYGGTTMTFGGNSYKVRLMRGWGQVSANTNGSGAPNYNTGPLMTISFATGSGGNNGTNWPTKTSPWNASSPNEWNTLIFPIASATQTQTASTPNWASYSNADLQVNSGNGRGTWTQETVNTFTSYRVYRGNGGLANVSPNNSFSTNSFDGLRLVFELIE